MRIRVDRENDALYFRLDENSIVESEEIRPGVILDFNKNGEVVGVEFLGIKSRIPEQELASMVFNTV